MAPGRLITTHMFTESETVLSDDADSIMEERNYVMAGIPPAAGNEEET